MLACCISACVSINRFGFALDGALCSLDRIYYDFKNGILKNTEDPRWIGFKNLSTISSNLLQIEKKIKDITDPDFKLSNCDETDTSLCDGEEQHYKIYRKLNISLNILKNIYNKEKDKPIEILNDYFKIDYNNPNNVTNFDNLKTEFLGECHDYGKILFGWMKVLAMIYSCLFLITITLAGVAMMFYACLKRQGYLITIMHILWNIIRFFMFSFFIYGAAYGIFELVLKDSIAVIQHLFSENKLGKIKGLVPKSFLENCLPGESEKEPNFASGILSDKLISELQNFYYTYKELTDILDEEKEKDECEKNDKNDDCDAITMIKNLDSLCIKNDPKNQDSNYDLNCKDLSEKAHMKGGIFGYFDCGFLEKDLNMAYRALYDMSKESKILSALSLTSSFFGAVAVYFYLLVLHHYNNELFFDSGKSIFRGFDGFGGGYKKKNRNQDPAYKKRKLRAEIELTSRNEEDNNYRDINKNEEDE
jgi:hypothetical protein